MYPTLFTIESLGLSVSSFGAMLALGFVIAHALVRRQLEGYGIDRNLSINLLVLIAFGGVAGSKLYYAIDHAAHGDGSLYENFFRTSGMTWYGGLAGAVLASWLASRLYRFSLVDLLDAGAPAIAVGQAMGRIGCFLNGDDYGVPTSAPWGVAFPLGQPPTMEAVHPTQLYEAAWLFLAAAFLSRRRSRSPMLFGEYMMLNGVGRVVIESWRLNPVVAFSMTQPQWIGVGLVLGGGMLWRLARESDRAVATSDSAAAPHG